MANATKKYIVRWTWDKKDTDKGIQKYEGMETLKRADDKIKDISKRKYPTSHGSSHGESPKWFTIFEATDEQLKNWLDHYQPELKVIEIKPLMSADEFIEKYRKGEIPLTYWYS